MSARDISIDRLRPSWSSAGRPPAEAPGLTRLVAYRSGTLDTVGTLENDAGEVLAADDDGGVDNNFRIEAVADGVGAFLRVEAFGDNTGPYRITVERSSH